MPRYRSLRLGVVLLFCVLALFFGVLAVTADYYGPEFMDEDCLCAQGDYGIEESSGSAGFLYCKYQKDEAANDLLHSWKSVYLKYNDTVEEAQANIADFLTDDHLKRYIDFTPTRGNSADFGLLDRNDMSLYGYHVDYYDPDVVRTGEYGEFTGKVPYYYLERRFVYQTYDILFFVTGEVFSSLDEAKAQVAEMESCMKDMIDSRPAIPPEPSGDFTIAGTITDFEGEPIKHAEVILQFKDQETRGRSNENGYYEFPYNEEFLGDEDVVTVNIYLTYERDGQEFFRVLYYDTPMLIRRIFQVKSPDDLIQDIQLVNNLGPPDYQVSPARYRLKDMGAIYRHMTEAVEFYLDRLQVLPEQIPPVTVRAFTNHSAETFYDSSSREIYFHYRDAVLADPGRPMNREWHEYSHHVMHSLYGTWPGNFQRQSVNHAGYANPDTADSYVEGFAEVMPVLMAEYYNYPDHETYANIGNLELNYKAWESEEFAAAGVLWDLLDERDEDSDLVDFTTDDVWEVLLPLRMDFSAVYDAFLERFSRYQPEIDEVFKAHGFYVDTSEPFGDWGEGEIVGRAADAARPERRSAGHIPGQYIKVDNQVPYYVVEFAFPDHPDYDYTIRTNNIDGYIYVQIPPEEYGATITLAGEDVQTGRPLSFSSEDYYQEKEQSTERGYFLSHDFEISGPIPPMPEPDVPESSEGQPHWLQVGKPPIPELDGPENRVDQESVSEIDQEESKLFGVQRMVVFAIGAGAGLFCLGALAIAVFVFGLGRRNKK